jgi:hypothetical protein
VEGREFPLFPNTETKKYGIVREGGRKTTHSRNTERHWKTGERGRRDIISMIHKEFYPITYEGRKPTKASTFQKNPQVNGGSVGRWVAKRKKGG